MGKRDKQIFHQRVHTHNKITHEKIFNMRTTKIKNGDSIKCWCGYRASGSLSYIASEKVKEYGHPRK